MAIKDELEIYIITYNRANELTATFESLISSPVRDFSITVLDNDSQDNTSVVCKKFQNQFSNLKYIKNNRNLGPAGNILKAMELASKKWLWILGDDDSYNWEAWPEIENALNQDFDIVNTCWHDGAKSDDPCVLLNEVGFVSTGIYQTKNITSIVMQNAYYLTLTLNPHSAIAAEVLNKGGKIYAPSQKLVLENMTKDYSKISVKKSRLHWEMRNYNVVYATLRIYDLIEDPLLRKKCNEIICLGNSLKNSLEFMIDCGIDRRRLIDTFFMLSFKQKLLLAWVIFSKRLSPIQFYRTNRGINIKLFWVIKTKICPLKKKK